MLFVFEIDEFNVILEFWTVFKDFIVSLDVFRSLSFIGAGETGMVKVG